MNDSKKLAALYEKAYNYADRKSYISDMTLLSMCGDDPCVDISADRIGLLGRIWDTAHLTVKDIRTYTGLSQAKFAERFHIPTRIIEDWERGIRKPPRYVVYLLALATGLAVEETI